MESTSFVRLDPHKKTPHPIKQAGDNLVRTQTEIIDYVDDMVRSYDVRPNVKGSYVVVPNDICKENGCLLSKAK